MSSFYYENKIAYKYIDEIIGIIFCSGSVGNVARLYGIEVVSLDRDMDADIKMDIMDWNYKEYPPQCFDITWA